jgi:hypothetical protein
VSTGPISEAVRNPVPPSGLFPSRPNPPSLNLTDAEAPAANYDGSDDSIDFDVASVSPKKAGEVKRDSPRAGIFPKPPAPEPPPPPTAEGPAPVPHVPLPGPATFRLQPLLKSKSEPRPPSFPSSPRPTAPLIEPFPDPPVPAPAPLTTQPRLGNRASWTSPPKPMPPSADWADEDAAGGKASKEFGPREFTPIPAPLPPPRPPGFPSGPLPAPPSYYSVPLQSYPAPAPLPPPTVPVAVTFGHGYGSPTVPGPEKHGLTPVALGFGAQRRGSSPQIVGVPSTPGLPVQQYLEMPLADADDGPTLPRVVTPTAPNLVFSHYVWKAARLVCFWLPARDVVQVSVFGPPEWAAGQTVKLLAYVHGRSSAAGLRTLSRTFRSESALLGTAFVDQLVRRGSTVGLHLSVVGGRVGRSLTGVVWAGDSSPVEFDVFVPPIGPGGLTRALLSIGLDGVKAGEVPFPAVIAQQR